MSYPEKTGITFDGKISQVIDGDTVEVEVVRRVRVRVRDCWAAETRSTDPVEKAKGVAAKKFASELFLGRRVRVSVVTDGDEDLGDGLSFGRVVADVWTDTGESFAETMISAGHATETKQDLK